MTATPSNSNDASPDEKNAKLRAFLKAKKESLERQSQANSNPANSNPANVAPSEELESSPDGWLTALNDAVTLENQATGFRPPPLSNLNASHSTRLAGNYPQPGSEPKSSVLGSKSQSASSMLERAERERQQKKEAGKQEQESQKSFLWIFGSCIAVLVPVILFFVYRTSNRVSEQFFGNVVTSGDQGRDSHSEPATSTHEQSGGSTRPSSFLGAVTGSETKRIELEAGIATFTIKRTGPHHLCVEFKNGLIADVDWEKNSLNDFGYDMYQPEVSETTNKFALMVTLRRIIANYLNGKY